MRHSYISVMIAITLAVIPASSQGFGFKNPFKKKHQTPPQNNTGGAAVVHNQQHTTAEQRATRLAQLQQREVDGRYQTSSSPLDDIPDFNGLFENELIDKIVTLTEGSPMAALKLSISQDLLGRGISVMPDAKQISALRELQKNIPLSQADQNLVNAYRNDIQLHRGYANFEIQRRANTHIYGRVQFDNQDNEYDAYNAVLDVYGAVPNDIYTPAPAKD
jgi:hypothetical protein